MKDLLLKLESEADDEPMDTWGTFYDAFIDGLKAEMPSGGRFGAQYSTSAGSSDFVVRVGDYSRQSEIKAAGKKAFAAAKKASGAKLALKMTDKTGDKDAALQWVDLVVSGADWKPKPRTEE